MKHQSTQPDITFIVPVYNAAQYLDECLQSLIKQNVNKEIICINDGSTDNSLAVLQKWAKKHPEIRIISQENKGLSITRNVGIDAAQGRYIWFVDADDSVLCEHLAALIAAADTHHADIVRGIVHFNQQDAIRFYYPVLPAIQTKYHNHEIHAELTSCADFLRASVHIGYMPKIWAGFYRTAFLREQHCYFPNARLNAEDEPFALQVFSAKPDALMYEISVPMYFYRQNPEGISRAKIKQFEGSLAAFELMLKWCQHLEQRVLDTPENDKRLDLHKNVLWTARLITLRMVGTAMDIFLGMDEQQQVQSKHLITPEHLRHLDEYKHIKLSSDAGSIYNGNSQRTFQLASQIRGLLNID